MYIFVILNRTISRLGVWGWERQTPVRPPGGFTTGESWSRDFLIHSSAAMLLKILNMCKLRTKVPVTVIWEGKSYHYCFYIPCHLGWVLQLSGLELWLFYRVLSDFHGPFKRPPWDVKILKRSWAFNHNMRWSVLLPDFLWAESKRSLVAERLNISPSPALAFAMDYLGHLGQAAKSLFQPCTEPGMSCKSPNQKWSDGSVLCPISYWPVLLSLFPLPNFATTTKLYEALLDHPWWLEGLGLAVVIYS